MKDKDPVKEFLKKQGSKGGKARAKKYRKEQLSAWAKLGGRPAKKGKAGGKHER